MPMVIPMWRVTIFKQMVMFVPETDLAAFLSVLTRNNLEFKVERENNAEGIEQVIAS